MIVRNANFKKYTRPQKAHDGSHVHLLARMLSTLQPQTLKPAILERML